MNARHYALAHLIIANVWFAASVISGRAYPLMVGGIWLVASLVIWAAARREEQA